MGPFERAIRRAVNPFSTWVTMLVQGAPSRRRALRAARVTAVVRPVPHAVTAGVVVPDVVGLGYDDARSVVRRAGLVAESPDPDGPPLAALGWPDGIVVAQDPLPGAVVPRGSRVRLWVERGPGSAGVREPRHPAPDPRSTRAMIDEATGDTVT